MQLALVLFSPPISRKVLHFVSSVRHPDKNTPPNSLTHFFLRVFAGAIRSSSEGSCQSLFLENVLSSAECQNRFPECLDSQIKISKVAHFLFLIIVAVLIAHSVTIICVLRCLP